MRKFINPFVWLSAGVFFVLSSLISIHRHLQYGTGYYDFGIFDTALWKISRFQPPIIDHYVLSGKVHMADHLTPSLYLFAPAYWFTSSQHTMFIIQAALVSLSAVVLFYTVRKMTYSSILAAALYLGYIGFVGLHSALYFDIHAVTFMTFFLALAYWALVSDKKKLFILAFILILGFKESLFVLGIGLSIVVFFYRKEWRKLAVILAVASVIWGLVATRFIIPYFSGMGYIYNTGQTGGLFGMVQEFYTPFQKVETIFWSVVGFAFLPLLGFETFFIMAAHYASRFLIPGSTRWGLALHYNAEIAPTLVFAAALGYNRLAHRIKKHISKITAILSIAIIVATGYVSTFVERSPMYLAFIPDFYRASDGFGFLDDMVSQVPEGASVMSQNNILGHFTHHDAWLTRRNYKDYDPDYILFDQRDGQSIAQILERDEEETAETFELVLQDPTYELVWHENEQYVFRKK